MGKITYVPKRFQQATLQIIMDAETILEEYDRQRLTMTLRQLYYQFVSRDLLPEKWTDPKTGSKNNIKSYNNIGAILNDARLAGMIDWELMKDETRGAVQWQTWDSPHQRIHAAAYVYNIDKWSNQEQLPEVWVEKDSLAAVVRRACGPLEVAYFSCRGYTSQTAMWEAGQRLITTIQGGQIPVIIHLGDHDPSGIDMSRDIEDRLRMFIDKYEDGDMLEFRRIALNMDQIKIYNPPPDPAKITDSRSPEYIEKYGTSSWELDALDPTVIVQLITDEIMPIRDEDLYQERCDQEEEEKAELQWIADHWYEIDKTDDDDYDEDEED